MTALAVGLFGVAACTVGAAPDDDPEIGEATPDGQRPGFDRSPADVVEATAGDVCLHTEDERQTPIAPFETRIEAGDEVIAELVLPSCLSGSCDVRRWASCNVERDGKVLTVSAEFEYVTLEDEFCTLDCEVLSTTCRIGPLDEGTYVVEHAGQSAKLTVPSTIEGCVIEPEYCDVDSDCDEGFCGQTLAGNHVCREYSEQGEACGGYGPPGMNGVCAPGLMCDDEGLAADLPGTCVLDARDGQWVGSMSMTQPDS